MVRVSLLVVMGAVLISGCGNSKLTDAQKQQVQTTASQVNDVSKAPAQANAEKHRAQMSAEMSAEMSTETGADTVSDRQAQMSSVLEQSQCEFEIKAPQSSSLLSSLSVGMKVSGTSCPISLDIEFDATGSADQVSGSFEYDYSVLNADYQKLNDIDSISLKGPFSASESEASLDVSGQIHSQTRGNIGLEVKATGSKDDSPVLTLTYTFPDFKAVLKEWVDGGQTKYSINDEEITAQEFATYVANLGSSSGSAEVDGNGPGGDQPTTPMPVPSPISNVGGSTPWPPLK